MTRIKICGITRPEDALESCKAGADALGFNFSAKSPRSTTPEGAREMVAMLPPFVMAAGIFVEQEACEVEQICRHAGLHIAQLHSERYTPADARAITSARVVRVFRPAEGFDMAEVREFAEASGVRDFLFDAYRPGMEGGTGERIEATLAERLFGELEPDWNAILAGGLNPANVAEAIRRLRPWAVDTASGVESAPGVKDPEKMRAFVRAVRSAEP